MMLRGRWAAGFFSKRSANNTEIVLDAKLVYERPLLARDLSSPQAHLGRTSASKGFSQDGFVFARRGQLVTLLTGA
jgi:hypothetical protein